MIPLLLLTAAVVALVGACVVAYKRATRKEAEDRALDEQINARWAELDRRARLIDARQQAMDRAMSDDHQCETCGAVTGVREMVSLHDDATLACESCASLLRGAA